MRKLFVLTVLLTACSLAAAAPLGEKHKALGFQAQPAQQMCMSCHGNYQAIAEKTKSVSPNPHANHMGEVQCDACHNWNGPSRYICNDCHSFPDQEKALNK